MDRVEGSAFVPIESFREGSRAASPYRAAFKPAAVFRSSGTSGGPRSVSMFSDEGLARYREASLSSLEWALRSVFSDEELRAARGISLIPTVGDWPDSSLARMIGWIGEAWPMEYATRDNLSSVLAGNAGAVWIFGTALHFVPMIRAETRVALPRGSVVIETGGMKGVFDAMTREELYCGLERVFGVTSDRILSEYGMCEIATPAWDVVPTGAPISIDRREFRFPDWVRVGITRGLGVVESNGRGALVIDDPRRVDTRAAIRTQDLVELSAQGGFRLFGRVPTAPLKGCSLRVEEVVDETTTRPRAIDVTTVSPVGRFNDVGSCLRAFLRSDEAVTLLSRELRSERAARSAIDDVLATIPVDRESWMRAIARSGADVASRWMIIPAGNHPMVALYPVAMAVARGLDVLVRRPGGSIERSFLDVYLSWIASVDGARVSTLPSAFRVGRDAMPNGVGAVMVFGDDRTVEAIRRAAGVPTRGFGSALTVAIVDAANWERDRAALVRDMLSLGQRGCLSARAAIVTGVDVPRLGALAESLARDGAAWWGESIPWEFQVALDHESWAWRSERLGWFVGDRRDMGEMLFPVTDIANVKSIDEAISHCPFVLPLIAAPSDGDEIDRVLSASSRVRLVVGRSSAGASSIVCRALGEANRPPWDGTHEGGPLFEVE